MTPATSTTSPTWRCSCAGCSRITLRAACDQHRPDVDQQLLAALAGGASASTSTASTMADTTA